MQGTSLLFEFSDLRTLLSDVSVGDWLDTVNSFCQRENYLQQ